MAKETIGIEALLHRAYAQYRVDKVTPQAVLGLPRFRPSGSLVGAMQALQLGTIIDNSGPAAKMLGFQKMAAATPDDMLLVHDHVLALEGWFIEGAESDAPQVWKREDVLANGWSIEMAASGAWLVRPMPEGEDSYARLLNPFLAALVIEHARNGTRPGHGGMLEPARGRPNAIALRNRALVMQDRALYATWYAALGLLAVTLDSVLVKHHVLGPVSPAAPWDRRSEGEVFVPLAVTA